MIRVWICGDSAEAEGVVGVIEEAPGWKLKFDHWRRSSSSGIFELAAFIGKCSERGENIIVLRMEWIDRYDMRW